MVDAGLLGDGSLKQRAARYQSGGIAQLVEHHAGSVSGSGVRVSLLSTIARNRICEEAGSDIVAAGAQLDAHGHFALRRLASSPPLHFSLDQTGADGVNRRLRSRIDVQLREDAADDGSSPSSRRGWKPSADLLVGKAFGD